MTDAIARQEQTAQIEGQLGPFQLIQQALSSGTSPEVIRELVTLQQSMERFAWEREERQAKIDFDEALNVCQSKIGRIAPNRKRENDIGWADYMQLDRTVRPIYLEAGFSIGFSESESADKGRLRMCATVSRGGISREYFADISRAPANSKMNQPDADASAASRVKRYLILDIFNIAVGIDRDERKPYLDGQQPGKLSERDNLSHYEAIKNAANMADLQTSYLAALAAAEAIGDAVSIKEFIAIKTSRMSELRRGNQ